MKAFWKGLHWLRHNPWGRALSYFVVLLATAFFLLKPFSPYVRISNASMRLALDCVPEKLRISLRTSYVKARRASLLLQDVTGRTATTTHSTQPLEAGESIVIALSQRQQSSLSEEFRALGPEAKLFALIEFEQVPFFHVARVDIENSLQPGAITCFPETLTGRELAAALDGADANVLWFARPQEVIGDSIWRLNDTIGSFLVAIMAVWTLTLLSSCIYGVCDYARGEHALKNGASTSETEQSVRVGFAATERSLAFARVVGPALGFLLTVSSLVEGLHPSAQSTQDSFRLIAALQLALVATFLGLAIRIFAEFAIRFHRGAAERKLRHLIEQPKE